MGLGIHALPCPAQRELLREEEEPKREMSKREIETYI
jgi:hypothetical protein